MSEHRASRLPHEAVTDQNRIHFVEVGARDGLQNLPEDLSTEAKLELLLALLDAGADLVEATSFSSPRWVPKLADSAEVMRGLLELREEDTVARVRVLAPNRPGLERAIAAGAKRAVANIAVTDSFNRRNLNRSTEEVFQEIGEMVALAQSAHCSLDVGISVAFGCPFEGRVDPEKVTALAGRLLELGIDELGIADTIGVADPRGVEELVQELGSSGAPWDRLSLHLHDTRGMGLANAAAAQRAGIRRYEGSVGGIGGCPFAPRATGNVCSEDLLEMFQRMGLTTSVDVTRLCQVSEWLEATLGRPLPGSLYRAGRWTGEPPTP